MTTIKDNPIRGKVLSTYLILLILLNLALMFVNTSSLIGFIRDHEVQYTGTEQWALPLLIFVEIVTIGALIALWFWRKAGYWVLIVTAVFETALLLLLKTTFLEAIQPVTTMVAIMWVVLQKRWQYFH